MKYTDPSGDFWNWPIVWAGNFLIGGMDRWINQKQPFKQAFSPANYPVVFSTNFSPGNTTKQNYFGFSNAQSEAQKIAGSKTAYKLVSAEIESESTKERNTQSGGLPLNAQRNRSGMPVGGNSTAQFFSNTTDAYNYMWKNSFDANGNPRVEISAWQISKGTIVMPYYKNFLAKSYNDYLPIETIDGKKNVYYNNSWNVITGHIHTHPCYNNGSIGIKYDYDIVAWLKMPITILWNNHVWQLNGRGSSPVDLGTW